MISSLGNENVYTKIHNSEQDIHVHDDEHQHGDCSKKEFKKMLSSNIVLTEIATT